MKLFRERLSDEQHIENIRKSVSQLEKYGYWLSAFHVLILLGGCLLYAKIMQLILNPPINPVKNQNGWVWIGFICGLTLGLGFAKAIHSCLTSVMLPFTGMRNEKLLLRYHDQVHGIEAGDFAELPDENPYHAQLSCEASS